MIQQGKSRDKNTLNMLDKFVLPRIVTRNYYFLSAADIETYFIVLLWSYVCADIMI